VAADVGADVITHFRTDDVADAATHTSACARTVSRTNRTTLEDANHSTLTTTLINTFFCANLRAVVPTLASADDAAVTCSHRITVNNLETDVLRRQSAAVHGAHDATVGGTHYFAFSGTDSKKDRAADHRTDGLYER
jgi:hypothetical protein